MHRAELKASEQRAARLEKALASVREEGRATAARDRDRRAAAEAEKAMAEEQLAVAGARVRELESRLSAADHACYEVCVSIRAERRSRSHGRRLPKPDDSLLAP